MTLIYFEKLNHHTTFIALPLNQIKKLYKEFLTKEKNPSYLMFCVFLAKKQIEFYSITQPSEEQRLLRL